MTLHQVFRVVEKLRAEGRVIRLDLHSSFFWIDEIQKDGEVKLACGPITDH